MGPGETYLFGAERGQGILLESMAPKKLTPMLDLNTARCQYAKTCTFYPRPSMVDHPRLRFRKAEDWTLWCAAGLELLAGGS